MNKWLLNDRDRFFGLSRPIRLWKAKIVSQRKRQPSPTAGLTNMVLHDRRINHTIMDPREKTKHLFIFLD